MMEADFCVVNGKLKHSPEFSLHPRSPAVLYGYGLFETWPVTRSVPVFLEKHYLRIKNSASAIGLEMNFSSGELETSSIKLWEASGRRDQRQRLNLTLDEKGTPLWWIVPSPMPKAGKNFKCLTAETPPGPLARHKSFSYMPNRLLMEKALAAGADETIMVEPSGRLLEGTMTSIFMARKGKLFTPSLDAPILPGVVREVLLEIAPGAGVEIIEKNLSLDELLNADEIFLTNSIRGVIPVVKINDKKFAGPASMRLTNLLQKVYNGEVNNYVENRKADSK